MKLSERLPRENGRDYALRNIKENIVSLELAPGSQISESELAAEMGLSRTPVREAIIELSRVKMIEIYPQRKSTVALIDYEMVDESSFIRNLLECAVVEQDCELATPADLERLQANIQLQKFYLDNFYSGELMALDNQFHKILFEIAKKKQAFVLIQGIGIHFDRVRSMALSAVRNTKIVQDHENILQAIRNRDPKTAKELMQAHLSRYKIDAAAIREAYPQYFK